MPSTLTLDQRLESLIGRAKPIEPNVQEKANTPSTDLDRRLESLVSGRERIAYPEAKPELLGAARQALTTPPTQYPFEARIPLNPDAQGISAAPERSVLGQMIYNAKQKIREKTGYFEPSIAGPQYREEQPLKTLAGAGAFYTAKTLSGLGLNIPDIIANKVSGVEGLADAVNKITGFTPTLREISAGEQAAFIGGLKSAGGVSGQIIKRIAARKALKMILSAGITFATQKTGEEVAKKVITGEPIDVEGIHFAGGVGVLFGAGEVGVQRFARFIQGVRAGKAIVPYKYPAGTKEAHRVEVRKEIQTALNEYKTTGDRTKWDAVRQKYTIGEQAKPITEAVKPSPTIAAKPSVEAVKPQPTAEPTETAPKTANEIMSSFYDYAKSKGYTKKIVGDLALRNKQNKIMRFRSGKGGVVTVWEQDVGKYELPLPKVAEVPPQGVPSVKPVAEKQPWEMKHTEYLVTKKSGDVFDLHEHFVKAAIEQGKPVPPEVLAEYPDLAKQAPAKDYFTLKKAQELTRIIPSKLTDEQLQNVYVKARDYLRYIDEPDMTRLLKGNYYVSATTQASTGFAPKDIWLRANLGTTLDEITAERQKRISKQVPDVAKEGKAPTAVTKPDIEGQMKMPKGFAAVPEFLQGGKGFGLKLYQDIFNRFAAIEDVTKKAQVLGMKIQPGEDPGKRARGYLGIAGKAQSVLEDKTFRTLPNGKYEFTGEGLKPILNDYESQGKILGKSEGLLKTNFKEYLKAARTIEDLQRPPYEGAKREIVTPKQVEEAKNTLANLKKQYGENIPILQNAAKRLYDYQSRILHLLVDSGNLSEEQFQNILKVNQFYVPFDRVMDDIEPTGVSPVSKRRFTEARAPVKRIKGSEREIYDPIESVVKNTYRILDAAERNTVARNVARLGEVLPEAIKPREIPIVPLAKVPLKAGIDPKLTAELLSVIDTLKGEYERKLKIGGRRMGYFKPKSQIVTKFGTSEGVIAHELGHYIDELYALKERLVKNPETMKELRALADLRQVRRAYARKGEEKIAALMDAFVTKPFILDDVAPNSKRILTSIINEHEELKPLLKIRPSMEIQYEKAVQTIFGQSPFKPKGNVIEYFENGKRKYIEVSPELYQAMSGMNEVSSSLFINILGKPAQWLRVGATMTPEFAFRNPLRDQWTAFMQTNVGFIPFVDTGRAIADILGKSQVYYDYLRSGAAQSGFVEMTRPALQKAVKELNRHPNLIKRLNILTDMQDLSQLMERGTRVGVYRAGIRQGLSPVEAGFISRESTLDFAKGGAKTRDVGKVIAFLKAGINGLDTTIRTFKNRPVSTTLKGIAAITIPSLLLYLKNRKDPEYKEIPTWQRDLFWITKVKDTYIRIPKPFLYGQVFGSIPERFFEYLDTKDPSAFDGLAKSVYESVSPVTGDPAGGILPTAVRPLVENYVNWNFFLGRKIIPEGKERLLPPEQYGRYTSDTAKKLGELLNYSPAKIENLARGWFGGTAQYALGASDYLLNGIRKEAGVKIPEKIREFEQMPLVRGFTIKPPTETGQAQSIEKFYDSAEKITSVYLTADKFIKEGRTEDAKRLILAHPEVKHYQIVNPVLKVLGELNQAVDGILKDVKLTGKEKEEKISRIQKTRVKLVQKVNQELKK